MNLNIEIISPQLRINSVLNEIKDGQEYTPSKSMEEALKKF